MPTMRSKFSFQQFEKVLMKIAHKIALDAVTTLKQGRTRIIIRGNGSFSEVETGKHHFRFYLSHASYVKRSKNYEDHFGFDIEEKLYLTSNHCSKISFWTPVHYVENRTYEDGVDEVDHKKTNAEKKRRRKKVMAFIDKMMADAGVSIEPRFQLSQMTQ